MSNYKNHQNHKYSASPAGRPRETEHTGPILEVRDLSVSFGRQEVLKDVSFSVNEGDILAIIGPNGAGKSVLFRALMGFIPFDGEIKWKADVKIGYVPQKFFEKLELPLTVREFFVLKSKNLFFKESAFDEAISHELKSVGLGLEILDKQLAHLSRGQSQRVLIAWAILGHPNVLLFDEPTAGIDLAGEDTIYNLLHKMKDERGLTVLIISHDLNIVYRYADNVLCVNKERICFGSPKHALTGEHIEKLYGESAFYHHAH